MPASLFPKLENYAPPSDPIKVLREGAAFLCLEKPSGLLSVPGKNEEHFDSMLSRVERQWPDARLIHRLDMDTSGIMIFAKTRASQRNLGLQFERRRVRKRYEALITGSPELECGEIDLPIITDWPVRPLQKICYETGRDALTRWKVLSREAEFTRIALYPKTGRSHQLRIHMQSMGHPIIGDRFYGGRDAPRLYLHAQRLQFYDPSDGEFLTVICDAPF